MSQKEPSNEESTQRLLNMQKSCSNDVVSSLEHGAFLFLLSWEALDVEPTQRLLDDSNSLKDCESTLLRFLWFTLFIDGNDTITLPAESSGVKAIRRLLVAEGAVSLMHCIYFLLLVFISFDDENDSRESSSISISLAEAGSHSTSSKND